MSPSLPRLSGWGDKWAPSHPYPTQTQRSALSPELRIHPGAGRDCGAWGKERWGGSGWKQSPDPEARVGDFLDFILEKDLLENYDLLLKIKTKEPAYSV